MTGARGSAKRRRLATRWRSRRRAPCYRPEQHTRSFSAGPLSAKLAIVLERFGPLSRTRRSFCAVYTPSRRIRISGGTCARSAPDARFSGGRRNRQRLRRRLGRAACRSRSRAGLRTGRRRASSAMYARRRRQRPLSQRYLQLRPARSSPRRVKVTSPLASALNTLDGFLDDGRHQRAVQRRRSIPRSLIPWNPLSMAPTRRLDRRA